MGLKILPAVMSSEREREKGYLLADLTGEKLASLADHTYLPRGRLIH